MLRPSMSIKIRKYRKKKALKQDMERFFFFFSGLHIIVNVPTAKKKKKTKQT